MCLVKFAFAYTYAPLNKFCACFVLMGPFSQTFPDEFPWHVTGSIPKVT